MELLRISVADALGIRVDPRLRERFERDAREYKESIPDGAKGDSDTDRDRRRSSDRRNSVNERSYYSDDRRADDRNSPTESRRYDDDRNRPTESRPYYYDRNRPTASQPSDDDLTRPTVNRPFEEPTEPKRDSDSRPKN